MGALGSLLVAMVTRVACGHSGRPLVADTLTWSLFLALQVATCVRLVGAWPGTSALWVTAAACAWTLVLAVWAGRLIGWFGRLRLDGEPG
ncbi:MAG: NnrS family protein [Burkholderiaceae bacterium]